MTFSKIIHQPFPITPKWYSRFLNLVIVFISYSYNTMSYILNIDIVSRKQTVYLVWGRSKTIINRIVMYFVFVRNCDKNISIIFCNSQKIIDNMTNIFNMLQHVCADSNCKTIFKFFTKLNISKISYYINSIFFFKIYM